MNAHDDPEDAADLRQRAEAQFQQASTESFAAMSPSELQRTLHELRVHQIELEMQNEELRLGPLAQVGGILWVVVRIHGADPGSLARAS